MLRQAIIGRNIHEAQPTHKPQLVSWLNTGQPGHTTVIFFCCVFERDNKAVLLSVLAKN